MYVEQRALKLHIEQRNTGLLTLIKQTILATVCVEAV